ncbi:MAG: DUF484 family protein [Gammaproteobacteria bacterium]|nr:DUF484 family protein [Gammaproteobacteria bacterium]
MTQPDKPQGAGRLPPAPIDEEAVAGFLAANPDFFARHPRLLTELDLQHAADGTVSLVDRQVQLLRTRTEDLRRHLNEILANATDNDGTFARTRTFTLALMDAADLPALDSTLAKHLVDGFEANHAICFVRGWAPPDARGGPPFGHLAGIRDDEQPPLARLFDADDPSCKACRPEDYKRLFTDADIDAPGSIALVPMHVANTGTNRDLTATLVIGAKDPRRFAPDMGKVFLFYIGDVLARTLIRLGLG